MRKRVLNLVVILLLLGVTLVVVGCDTQEETAPPETEEEPVVPEIEEEPVLTLTIGQHAELAQPAVMLVVTRLTAEVTNRETGESEIAGDFDHIDPSENEPVPIPKFAIDVMGTGFLVSPDGYLLTTAHVVEISDDGKNALWEQFLDWFMENSDAYYEWGPEWTEGEVNWLRDKAPSHYALGEVERGEVFCLEGQTLGTAIIEKGYKARVVSEYPEKDIAILSVDGNNFPSMLLGDSSTVALGDRIMAMGYPAAALQEGIPVSSQSGTITSTDASHYLHGHPVLQTDAPIQSGMSGGPVINEQGEVIGLSCYGFDEGAGLDWLVHANDAAALLKQHNIENQQGPTDQHYRQAMIFYRQGEYAQAMAEFEKVRNLYPGHKYVNDFVRKCQQELSK